jgi:hypothetical protein
MATATKANPRDFEKMTDEEILTQFLKDINASMKFQQPFFEKFIEFYKLYRSYIDEADKRPHGANLFIPYTFSVIETVTPKIVNALFHTKPYISTIPIRGTSYIKSKNMNKLLDYQLTQKIKVVTTVTDIIKGTLLYGTGISKQTWEFKSGKRVEKQPIMSILGFPIGSKEVLMESIIKDEPSIKSIPLMDFFFDPAGVTIEEQRYCADRYYEDYHVLLEKEKEGVYKNVKEKLGRQGYDDSYNQAGSSDMLDNIGLSTHNNKNKSVEIIEYYTDDWKLVIANRDTVLQSTMTPYNHFKKPYAKWVDTPVPNEFYGIGEIEPIQHLQEELNATRNQRIDNVSLIINRMYKILRVADINQDQLVSRPNGFIEVDSMADVEPLIIPDVSSSAYNEEAVIKEDIDKTIGVHDSARGSSPDRRETATTMNILSNASYDRFKLKILLIENGGLKDAMTQVVQLNQQYIDRDTMFTIINDQGVFEEVELTPEDIAGEFDLMVVGSNTEPSINKEYRQNQLIQLYNIVKDSPLVNQPEFLKTIFEAFDVKNINELIIEQQPMQEPPIGVGEPPMQDPMTGGGEPPMQDPMMDMMGGEPQL